MKTPHDGFFTLHYILVCAKMLIVLDAFAIIAEPNRRKILRIIWDVERSAGDIAAQFDVTFGAVSQHLHVLREAGLLDMRKTGRSRFYRARKESLGPFAKALEAMWSDALDRLKFAAESEEAAKKRKRKISGNRPCNRVRSQRNST